MSSLERLKSMPWTVHYLKMYLDMDRPLIYANDPVAIPRPIFDSLCLAALVGLESADDYREEDKRDS